MRAFRDREQHRNVDNVVPFLFRMVANRATDVLRKRRRSEPLSHRAAAPAEPEHWIQGLLDRLPAAQADVIRLRNDNPQHRWTVDGGF